MADTIRKKRESVLTLHSNCKKSSRNIGGIFDVSQSTVSRINQRFEETETASPNEKENRIKSQKLLLEKMLLAQCR